jgi:hypothetical protein
MTIMTSTLDYCGGIAALALLCHARLFAARRSAYLAHSDTIGYDRHYRQPEAAMFVYREKKKGRWVDRYGYHIGRTQRVDGKPRRTNILYLGCGTDEPYDLGRFVLWCGALRRIKDAVARGVSLSEEEQAKCLSDLDRYVPRPTREIVLDVIRREAERIMRRWYYLRRIPYGPESCERAIHDRARQIAEAVNGLVTLTEEELANAPWREDLSITLHDEIKAHWEVVMDAYYQWRPGTIGRWRERHRTEEEARSSARLDRAMGIKNSDLAKWIRPRRSSKV